ncbi:hypothetical protein BDV35DRAFT_31214 [Aspergillus flavus]|uniref:Uncharacterized protein n=1 Tax=Aspergillus flavus TaxID=5059 RepID=A0A5N6GL95_ASPFL|nr:hypothetical protein BDV35DRAFT_31214 [Aspergillus flavus]
MAYCERLRPSQQRSSQGVILSIICVNAVVPLLSIITDILIAFHSFPSHTSILLSLTSSRHLLAFVPFLPLSLVKDLFFFPFSYPPPSLPALITTLVSLESPGFCTVPSKIRFLFLNPPLCLRGKASFDPYPALPIDIDTLNFFFLRIFSHFQQQVPQRRIFTAT